MTRSADIDGVQAWLDILVAACNAHDVEAVVACFAEDYVNETPAHPARGFHGRDQVRHNWTAIFSGVPDIRVRLVRHAIDGSTLWAEMEMDGTRRDGMPHAMRGVVIFMLDRGLATNARFYLEPLEAGSDDASAFVTRTVGVSAT